jgi:hypothetical protein
LTASSPYAPHLTMLAGALDFVCFELGLELAADKYQPPTRTPTVLGYVIDTVNRTVTVVQTKLDILQARIASTITAPAKRKQWQSLVGKAIHVLRIFPAARPLLGPILSTRASGSGLFRPKKAAIQCLRRLSTALQSWSGTSLWTRASLSRTADIFSTDASLIAGGAYCHKTGQCIYILWADYPAAHDKQGHLFHINKLEALTVVIAFATFCHRLSGKAVHYLVDNTSAISWLTHGYCPQHNDDQAPMEWLLAFTDISVQHDILSRFTYIKSEANSVADAISRVTAPNLLNACLASFNCLRSTANLPHLSHVPHRAIPAANIPTGGARRANKRHNAVKN